jgi:glycosyltransferase involved in cell wall biosynthesis
MNRPKLLFLVTEDRYFCTHRLSLAVAALEAGYEVTVATRISEYGDLIRSKGLRLAPISLSRRAGNPIIEIFRIALLYFRLRPDIVHQVALKPVIYGTIAARLMRVPTIINAVAGLGWLNDTNFSASNRVIKAIIRKMLGWLIATSSGVTIIQNLEDYEVFVGLGVPSQKLALVRGAGVDINIFYPAKEPQGKITVILPARMLWAKGVAEFVAAAKILYKEGLHAQFILVGGIDSANAGSVSLEDLNQWNGRDGIEWWGRHEDMATIFRRSHIVCLPTFYGEGLPKSLLEAAASGRPIVTTDTPGCRDIVINGENGFLVKAKDIGNLVNALRELILNPDLRHYMGSKGRNRVLKEFVQEKIIAQTLALYPNKP